MGNLASGGADRLADAASYVDNHDLKDAFNGVRRFAHRHLRESVVFAATPDFLAVAAWRRAANKGGKTFEED